MLRGFRNGGEVTAGGGGGGGGVGPARLRTWTGPAPNLARPGFFCGAQWVKRPQCVAMLLCRQPQKYNMCLQMETN